MHKDMIQQLLFRKLSAFDIREIILCWVGKVRETEKFVAGTGQIASL
jgi:hypothetical protein